MGERISTADKLVGYCAMNLNGFSILCRVAQNQSVDLWHCRVPSGAGMEAAVAYLAPFVMNPEKWEKKQIQRFDAGHSYFFGACRPGICLRRVYLSMHRGVRKVDDTWALLVEMILHTL
jgi:hypothetical protein